MLELFEEARENSDKLRVSKPQSRKKSGRPTKAEVLRRSRAATRTPITGEKSLLAVEGKKPDYNYRWVRDTEETGSEVVRFLSAGYEFVTRHEGIKIGENAVYSSKAVGSMIRVSAGSQGDYLYLMKIPTEWYELDQEAKAVKIDKTEEALQAPDIGGTYGSIKIS